MNNIKLDIKKIVSENLQKTRKQRLEESFNHIKDIKDDSIICFILYSIYTYITSNYDNVFFKEKTKGRN